MLDIAVAYNRYRFLGNEFLTWLWYIIENEKAVVFQCDREAVGLEVGNRMILENRWANGKETISIKGDAVGLEEGQLCLSKGGAVTEINLIYKSGALQWQFSLKGESLNFSGLKLPESGAVEQPDDMEGIVLEKIDLYDKPIELVDSLYRRFIELRLSDQWKATTARIEKWVHTQSF